MKHIMYYILAMIIATFAFVKCTTPGPSPGPNPTPSPILCGAETLIDNMIVSVVESGDGCTGTAAIQAWAQGLWGSGGICSVAQMAQKSAHLKLYSQKGVMGSSLKQQSSGAIAALVCPIAVPIIMNGLAQVPPADFMCTGNQDLTNLVTAGCMALPF